MSVSTYDVLVIGGGPGGYVAAIRAAQLGFKVACVDKWVNGKGKPVYGGTCLNIGCIPSKALLESSHNYLKAKEEFSSHGINISDVDLDLTKMQKRKEKVVTLLTGGIEALFKRNKVEPLSGIASIDKLGDLCEVSISGRDAGKISAKNLIIATGSVPREIPMAKIDGENIVDNERALSFSEVPEKLGIIGSGVIGLELGSVWCRLGSNVTILEALPNFLAAADKDIAKQALTVFRKQGLKISLESAVKNVKTSKKGEVTVAYASNGEEHKETFNKLIVAVGRVPFTDGLNLSNSGLELDERGCIKVNNDCQTEFPNVYAIGDVVRGPMLAHKAEEEGVMVAELLAGQKPEINYDVVPWVIYTHPEIAWAGKTEQDLSAEGKEYTKGLFPFMANGRAQGLGETEGMVKILADKETDRVLGAHIFGPSASDMIAEAVLAMEFCASSEDIARTIHAHPTLTEVFKEAALAVDNRAIHI